MLDAEAIDALLVTGDVFDGGNPPAAALSDPSGVALDSAGNLYIADERNHRIRKR